MLSNTYYRLRTEKKLRVAYFGGSVTDGFSFDKSCTREHSWRTLSFNWLCSQFPDATITQTNAGVGGTGTIFGAYRAIDHLKLASETEKPDLVFIEFAINDSYGNNKDYNTTPGVYMESIVQTIYKYAPKADIVMVFTTDYRLRDTEFSIKLEHREVADAYHIPYVDVGARLWKDMVEENGGEIPVYKWHPGDPENSPVWEKHFSDNAHPAKAGYAKYAQYLIEFLDDVFKNKTEVPACLVDAYKPSAPLHELPIAPYIDGVQGVVSAEDTALINENGFLVSDKAGTTLTFRFTGTDLRFWVYAHSFAEEEAGCLEVQVDGGETKKLSLVGNNHLPLPAASNLANGEHTVKAVLSPATPAGGVNLDLRYVLITGDTQMRGITAAE